MSVKVLLVEDDPNLGFVIKDNLAQKKYDVTLSTNGEDAFIEFNNNTFDLCLLDVMLPKKDGFSLAQQIRLTNKEIPILFITAKGMLEDKVIGFKSGGDDYLVKPFSMEELCLRLEVFLRRAKQANANESIFKIGSYDFDFKNQRLQHSSGHKNLTEKEAQVLKLLCQNRTRILKREEILKTVWGQDDYFMGRSLDVFISRLRKLLKEDPQIQITNFHSVGFKIETD
jgi:DNA-binding response OmpR family regulator